MRFLHILVSVTFICSGLNAQLNPLGAYNQLVVQDWNGEYIRIGPYQVKGSPFLFGEAFMGKIAFKGGKEIKNTKILYNLHNQEAGLEKNNEIFKAEDPVTEFTISLTEKYGSANLHFVSSDVYDKSDSKSFYNVLNDGSKIAFLRQFKIKLIPDPSNTMAKDVKAVDQYMEYYIYSKEKKELVKVKLKEKEILKYLILDDNTKRYIYQNKIDFSKENELVKFFSAYNTDFK